MEKKELCFRQIHMDYHTCGEIDGVAEKFDAEEFADALERARVNSVTCFSRCHHGYLYYDSKKYPELIHPGLKNRNLLKQQIAACHRRGIRVPVYTTVQWDYRAGLEHPEWVCLNPDGSLKNRCSGTEAAAVYEPGFYRTLCVNSPYRDFLKSQILDVAESLGKENIDGFFLDIVNPVDCSCRYCRNKMIQKGMNPANVSERKEFARQTMKEFKEDMSAFIREIKDSFSIFYNSGHINYISVDAADAYTHWELESLPSGEWGYSHFVNTVRFARTTGKEIVAHTGKFHTEWGDFHSYKNIEALQYECFRMLAYNAKCLIGDQLEPDGRISKATYDLIGKVYASVEQKEEWCERAAALTDLAVFSTECLSRHTGCGGKVPAEVDGACKMLDELGYQLDIVDYRSSFENYKVLIFPDTVTCSEELAEKIRAFIAGGGTVIMSARSGLDRQERDFCIPEMGIRYEGHSDYDVDFLMPNELAGKQLPKTEHVMYTAGERVKAEGADILADTYVPYFSRTWEHFCSHKHAPSSHQYGYPAIMACGNCYYFAHPVFSIYQKKHPAWCREVVKDILERCIPAPLIRHNGPASLLTTINAQEDRRRYVVHLLHYIPRKECDEVYTIEDVIPLYDLELSVCVPQKVKSVKMVPEQTELKFDRDEAGIFFKVPKVCGHQMIELKWDD